jgi:hypothetical protein
LDISLSYLDEAKASRPAGISVSDDPAAFYLNKRAKSG